MRTTNRNENFENNFRGRFGDADDWRCHCSAVPSEDLQRQRIQQRSLWESISVIPVEPTTAYAEASWTQLQRHLSSGESSAVRVPQQDSLPVSADLLKVMQQTAAIKIRFRNVTF